MGEARAYKDQNKESLDCAGAYAGCARDDNATSG